MGCAAACPWKGRLEVAARGGRGIRLDTAQATPEEWTIEAYVLAAAVIYYVAKRFLRTPSAAAASAAPDR